MVARIRVSVAKLLHADGRLSQLDEEETAILNHLFSIVFTDEESSYIQRLAKQEVTEELSDFTVENIRKKIDGLKTTVTRVGSDTPRVLRVIHVPRSPLH